MRIKKAGNFLCLQFSFHSCHCMDANQVKSKSEAKARVKKAKSFHWSD